MKRRFFAQLGETAEMIKISHSIFALPFALAAAALAMRGHGGWSWETVLWIVLCAVFARTAAMAQNRLIDARIDAQNPRTASRALPAGRVMTGFVRDLVLGSSVLFVLCAWMLNDLCLYVSPIVLVVLLTYPYAKRFTALSHIWLGASLGLAPVGNGLPQVSFRKIHCHKVWMTCSMIQSFLFGTPPSDASLASWSK